jgi:hypothetical protein
MVYIAIPAHQFLSFHESPIFHSIPFSTSIGRRLTPQYYMILEILSSRRITTQMATELNNNPAPQVESIGASENFKQSNQDGLNQPLNPKVVVSRSLYSIDS